MSVPSQTPPSLAFRRLSCPCAGTRAASFAGATSPPRHRRVPPKPLLPSPPLLPLPSTTSPSAPRPITSTRWILKEYASKWLLVAAAVRAAYRRNPLANAGKLVVWRAATPRDFEGGVAKAGGRCRRREPLRHTHVSHLERELDPSSMRFAVLTKNLIMDAVAVQHAPWVRVLDAYSIARQRADGHPGPDPKTNMRGNLHKRAFDDCLHYCLPGVPDLYNGRLLHLLQQAVLERHGGAAADADAADGSGDGGSAVEGRPGLMLARYNFELGGRKFVQGASPRLAMQMWRDGEATSLACSLIAPGAPLASRSAAEGGATPPLLGMCSDLDPASAFRHHGHHAGRNSSSYAPRERRASRSMSASLAELAAASRRAISKAELLGKPKAEAKAAPKTELSASKTKGASRGGSARGEARGASGMAKGGANKPGGGAGGQLI